MRFPLFLRRVYSRFHFLFGTQASDLGYMPVATNVQRSSVLKYWVHVQPVLFRHVSFFIGLPFAIGLAYINSTLALCLSFLFSYLAFLLLFQVIEDSFVYPRNVPIHARTLCDSPSSHGFSNWEYVKLFPDGKTGPIVSGFLLLQQDATIRSSCPTIFILHGNAGNMGHRLPLCRLVADQVQCNILIIDYRGYGKSTGYPTENGLYADALAGLEYLQSRSDICESKIFLFGRSLGGGVAIQLATSPVGLSLCGVIVENTFTSMPLAAQNIFSTSIHPVMKHIMRQCFFANKYPSLERLLAYHVPEETGRIVPFLFISGGSDELIPPSMMQQLATAYDNHQRRSFGSPGSPSDSIIQPSAFIAAGTHGLVRFPNGKHADTWRCENWPEVFACFVQRSIAGHV